MHKRANIDAAHQQVLVLGVQVFWGQVFPHLFHFYISVFFYVVCIQLL